MAEITASKHEIHFFNPKISASKVINFIQQLYNRVGFCNKEFHVLLLGFHAILFGFVNTLVQMLFGLGITQYKAVSCCNPQKYIKFMHQTPQGK